MQRLRKLRLAAALFAVGFLTTACSSPPSRDGMSAATNSVPDVSVKQAPPVLLAPGPTGTPLPPRNPDAARDWPPEFRRFVDAALELFKPGTREPTLQEFEAKLGIKILPSNWKKTDGDRRMQVYRVEAPWIYRVKPIDPPFWVDMSTLTELPRGGASTLNAGVRTYMLEFKMNTDMPRCINPYDLAVYSGANFSNDDTNPHQLPRPMWNNAYEWGMFKRGYFGRYISNKSFGISVNAHNSSGPASHDATCVTSFWIIGRFQTQ